MLLLIISSYMSFTLPLATYFSQRVFPSVATVSKSGAIFQVGLWILMYGLFIYLNER
jgi:hypothetical protein